jgi:hypothetical protein
MRGGGNCSVLNGKDLLPVIRGFISRAFAY